MTAQEDSVSPPTLWGIYVISVIYVLSAVACFSLFFIDYVRAAFTKKEPEDSLTERGDYQ